MQRQTHCEFLTFEFLTIGFYWMHKQSPLGMECLILALVFPLNSLLLGLNSTQSKYCESIHYKDKSIAQQTLSKTVYRRNTAGKMQIDLSPSTKDFKNKITVRSNVVFVLWNTEHREWMYAYRSPGKQCQRAYWEEMYSFCNWKKIFLNSNCGKFPLLHTRKRIKWIWLSFNCIPLTSFWYKSWNTSRGITTQMEMFAFSTYSLLAHQECPRI